MTLTVMPYKLLACVPVQMSETSPVECSPIVWLGFPSRASGTGVGSLTLRRPAA